MRKLKKIFEKIFSVKHVGLHIHFTFMGIKFKTLISPKYNNEHNSLPIQNNKIIFRHHIGSYACNVKYITEEILRQNLPYELVWIVNENIDKYKKDFPNAIKLIQNNTDEERYEYSTAKIWIDSERRSDYIKTNLLKRPEQIYIQTFHGSLGIKKTGADRKNLPTKAYKYSKIDAKQIDYLISNGSYTTNFFKNIFWNNGNILETGHPRNDIFFKDNSKIKEKVYKHFNIAPDKKIVMYAPTLREDKDMTCFNLNYEHVINALNQKFGDEWIFLVRLHPLILELKDKLNLNSDSIIDATEYSDMQELLVSSDALITDYSSCIYDFMLSRKPGFIFATDVKKYDNSRGLYYPLTSTPFPVAENNNQMINNILNFDNETYLKNVDDFLAEKGCIDDGHASERVVELIKGIITKAECENKEILK